MVVELELVIKKLFVVVVVVLNVWSEYKLGILWFIPVDVETDCWIGVPYVLVNGWYAARTGITSIK